MSGRDPLVVLQQLAALKARRALAELAAARARAQAAAEAVAAQDAAAAETYDDTVPNAAAAQALWARRTALAEGAAAGLRERQRLDRAAGTATDAAATALARELGAKAMAARAAVRQAQAEARRHERSMGVLAAIRGPSRR